MPGVPGCPSAVANLFYDAAHNRTTADVTVKAQQDKIVTLNLAFKNTDGGVKDIKLLRPDPWGHPYQYKNPGVHHKSGFDIWSQGADGADGGEGDNADIGNW